MRFISIVVAMAAAAAAGPVQLEDLLEKRQGTCNANNAAFRVISNLGARGSAFCNNYLGLPAATTIVEEAPEVTPVVTSIIDTVTEGVCAPSVSVPAINLPGIITRILPGFTLPTRLPGIGAREEAEALEKRQLIPALSVFAASRLSAGCSCLSLTPSTVVITSTPTAAPVVTEVIATTCSTA
ncbi:hypothetical protein Q7P37_007917 [Cladosporium fusiforme]